MKTTLDLRREHLKRIRALKRSLVLASCLFYLPLIRAAAIFTVTTSADSGPGSFRQAILNANLSPSLDSITFALPAASRTITPLSALPVITDPVLIDGWTQSGFSGNPIVELAGPAAGLNANGIILIGSGSVIRGLVINRFSGTGILLQDGGTNVIEGNFVGTDVTGMSDQGNGLWGIALLRSSGNLIGGTNLQSRNVISGNQSEGVSIMDRSNGNRLEGNIIGLDADGFKSRGNGSHGILVSFSQTNVIGGDAAGAGNVISANQGVGILLENDADGNVMRGNIIGLDISGDIDRGNTARGISVLNSYGNKIGGIGAFMGNVISGNADSGIGLTDGASQNIVQGNLIGTDASGTIARRNGDRGVIIGGATSAENVIGGTLFGARNLISGNRLSGVLCNGGTVSNVIQGNFIGTDITGRLPLGNGSIGVNIDGGSDNTIGGSAAGVGNRIAFNTDEGVRVAGGSRNAILGNSIFLNGSLGIDLTPIGVTANDLRDSDGGPNARQNFPILTEAAATTNGLVIAGGINTLPNVSGVVIEFFSTDACDPSGYGEGQTLLGRTTLATDASGNAAFSVTLPIPTPVGPFITATATLANNTSEFSPCLALPILTFRRTDLEQVALEWSADATGFQLESTETLSPAAWTPVVAAIETTNGVNRVITVTGNGIRFYRLKK